MPPCPKPSPRWIEKAQRKADEAKAIKDCYREVDRRDGSRCRICERRVCGVSMDTKRIHHHLVYRSAGGDHLPANVLSICPRCDDLIHREGKLRVTGDANKRNSEGRFCGVRVQRWVGDGKAWQCGELV